MADHDFGNLLAHLKVRGERAHRILEHHADAGAPHVIEHRGLESQQLAATKAGAPLRAGVPRQEAQHREKQLALARAGLPDYPPAPAAGDGARAASTNWRRLRERVSARTMRAVVSQPTAPSESSRTPMLPRSKSVVRMMTMKRYGSEYSTSTKRIIQASVRAPASPAMAPQAMPIARLTRLASRLIRSESRTPESVRTNRSRPRRSVPNQCAAMRPGGRAGCRQSMLS